MSISALRHLQPLSAVYVWSEPATVSEAQVGVSLLSLGCPFTLRFSRIKKSGGSLEGSHCCSPSYCLYWLHPDIQPLRSHSAQSEGQRAEEDAVKPLIKVQQHLKESEPSNWFSTVSIVNSCFNNL